MSSDYDLRIKLNSSCIVIKLVDTEYNIFKKCISKLDPFVNQYLNQDLSILKGFLDIRENIDIIEQLNIMKLILKKPIYLEYILEKQENNSFEKDIKKEIIIKFNQLSILENRLIETNNRISKIEKQLSYGVILPGYKNTIPINSDTLLINYIPKNVSNFPEFIKPHSFFFKYDEDNVCLNDLGQRIGEVINPYYFDGHTLEPLSYLKNLKRLFLRHNRDKITDISPLYECKELEVLRIDGFDIINSIDFSKWINLKSVTLHNLKNLEDIKTLEKIDIDDLNLYNCPKILNIPNLPSKVKVMKN